VREKLTGVNVSGLYFMAADVGTTSEGKQWQGRRKESKGGSGSGGGGLRRRRRAAALNQSRRSRNRNEREQGLRDPDSAPDARIRGADAAFTVGHQTGGAAAQWSRQWRECVTAGRGAASL
jgi:hypothetical protein